ncbi:MAG: exodeoxyribonuclease VII large subunit [Marinilabiliaceae bacterium]|nr:exodeoxyribonuclease VII large subunit [Marinilabiliaceae bacterium]
MAEHLSLYDLNHQIKEQLESSFGGTYWVVAEISELRTHRSGHCYLELIEKDKDSEQVKAKARATIWAFTFRMLKPYFETTTGQALTAGMKVLVRASIEYQEVYGLSLNIKDIDPTFTLGDIARRRMQIIQQLEDEGVMDMNKEVELPSVPQTFAIISSPSAAGYEDFINQLENNPYGFKIYHKLFPAIMQGDQTEPSIIEALERIYNYEEVFDAVVIIRGGGSTADLMCFDSYLLALNITQFPLPVLTGIGHERDESVVDMVAHTKLKTPTAVAEFIIDRIASFQAYVEDLQDQFTNESRRILKDQKYRLDLSIQKLQPLVKHTLSHQKRKPEEAAQRLLFLMKSYFDNQQSYFSHVKESIRYLTSKKVKTEIQETDFLKTKLKLEIQGFLKNKRQQIHLAEKTNQLSDPLTILDKGYSITYSNEKIVKEISQLKKGDLITTRLNNGAIISRVENIKRKK